MQKAHTLETPMSSAEMLGGNARTRAVQQPKRMGSRRVMAEICAGVACFLLSFAARLSEPPRHYKSA